MRPMPNLVSGTPQEIVIGIIGGGRQGRKLLDLIDALQKKLNVSIHVKILGREFVKNAKNVFSFDGFIVATPNSSHLEILEVLSESEKPCLVEKPLVNDESQLKQLESLIISAKPKVMMNYPFEYSPIADHFLDVCSSRALGDLVKLEFMVGHGYGFKNDRGTSWRLQTKYGVGEMLSVHYINYCLKMFGNTFSAHSIFKRGLSSPGVVDFFCSTMDFWNGPICSVTTSYCSPFVFEIKAIGTNGIFNYGPHGLELRSPRETLNTEGRFVEPPSTLMSRIGNEENWRSGQLSLLAKYLDCVISGNLSSEISTAALRREELTFRVLAESRC